MIFITLMWSLLVNTILICQYSVRNHLYYIYPSIYDISMYLSIYMYMYLSIICLSTCTCTCLHVSIYYLYIYMYMYLSTCIYLLSVYVHVPIYMYLSIICKSTCIYDLSIIMYSLFLYISRYLSRFFAILIHYFLIFIIIKSFS